MKQGTSGTTDLSACVCVCVYVPEVSGNARYFLFIKLVLVFLNSFGSFGSRACVDVFVHVLFLLFPIYISFLRGT